MRIIVIVLIALIVIMIVIVLVLLVIVMISISGLLLRDGGAQRLLGVLAPPRPGILYYNIPYYTTLCYTILYYTIHYTKEAGSYLSTLFLSLFPSPLLLLHLIPLFLSLSQRV